MKKLTILDAAAAAIPCCTRDPEHPGHLLAHNIRDFPDEGASLVTSALTGGFFEQHLADAVKDDPTGCLLLAPLCHKFSLPCPSGIGQPVTEEALQQLLSQLESRYSPHLECCYLYDPDVHAVILYDDETTLQKKAATAEKMQYTYLAATPEILQKIKTP